MGVLRSLSVWDEGREEEEGRKRGEKGVGRGVSKREKLKED